MKVDGGSSVYVYDALNRRVRQQTASGTYEYVYDPAGRRTSRWNVAFNSGDEGRIYWDGRQIAFRAYDGTTYFEHQDWMGTERVRTNYTGVVASSYPSLPWGDGFTSPSTPPYSNQDTLQYAQLDHDSESGTEHAQFRQYSSTWGRWMSPDPYDGSYDATNPQSLNRYSYVLNGPLTFTDPSGLRQCNGTPADTDGFCFTSPPSPGGTPLPWYIAEYGGNFCGNINGGGGPCQTSPALAAPNNVSCAGKTTLVNGNIRIQANAAGVITAVGIPLTGASGYQTTTDYGVNFQVQPSTIVGVSLNPNGSLSVGVNNPIFVSSAGSFFGGYVSSLTFSNGAFTQVNGSVSFLGIHGSTSTPSSRLAGILNSNSGLTNAAQLLQSAAQLAQSIVGCKVGG
ncbi:RHS repeat protein [Tunturibacter empetritectus]|uniref:RHS repeat-associated protein n=1 Tax=Tunturiibacter lichenicola TaxID=2051959 RepID=A0A7W8JAU1_9BACT|nr:RHS repeat-associated core domain-containing protein [Edaphobacter lichenicola]MBB5345863.1 RHS repeat-associated protein [Edaphobacter lichenicola]